MGNEGWISLHRRFLDWEWYDDSNTMRLFIHCLLLANYETKKWRGKLIKRGQFITSQSKLANSLKLSKMQIRNSLKKLKTTHEITCEGTSEYTIITVLLYNEYQDKQHTKQHTKNIAKQHTSNTRVTTTNKDNNSINSSYINSLSLLDNEREILKNYVIRKKLAKSSVEAYVSTLIKNGDYKAILEKEKKRLEKLSEKGAEEIVQDVVELTPEDEEKIKEIQRMTREKLRKRG